MKILVDVKVKPFVSDFWAWAQGQGFAISEWDLESKPDFQPSILISGATNLTELSILSKYPQIQSIFTIREDHVKEDLFKLQEGFNERIALSKNHSAQIPGEIRHYVLDQTDLLDSAIKDFSTYVESQNVFQHLSDIARTVASELLTNAFYNAPVDNEGKPLHSDRSKRVKLPSHKKVEFSYGDDGTHLWMSVRDSYGSFSRLGLLRNLIRCAQYEKLTVRQTGGGAGIGLFMVYSWAAQLKFHFTPGAQTFVHVKLLKTKRIKTFDSQKVNLEIVETPISARKVA